MRRASTSSNANAKCSSLSAIHASRTLASSPLSTYRAESPPPSDVQPTIEWARKQKAIIPNDRDSKKTNHIWEDAYMKIETDKESASLDGPSEKSIPDFSETAQRLLRLGDSVLKVLSAEGRISARSEGRAGKDWPPNKLSFISLWPGARPDARTRNVSQGRYEWRRDSCLQRMKSESVPWD